MPTRASESADALHFSAARSTDRAVLFALAASLVACASGTLRPVEARVAPSPPPPDDGKPASGGSAGHAHAAALEELAVGTMVVRVDPQRSVRTPLPDGAHWTVVRFLGIPSLVGFRYGKDHHAVAGAFVMPVEDAEDSGACQKAFESYAQPWIDSFEIAVEHDRPTAIPWHGAMGELDVGRKEPPSSIVDIDSVVASTATLGVRDQYAGAYAAYPAWKGTCLIFGVAIPARGDLERAKTARDRFVRDVFPAVQITARNRPQRSF